MCIYKNTQPYISIYIYICTTHTHTHCYTHGTMIIQRESCTKVVRERVKAEREERERRTELASTHQPKQYNTYGSHTHIHM